jgi:tetratricopeptide (TPR) repeat protein
MKNILFAVLLFGYACTSNENSSSKIVEGQNESQLTKLDSLSQAIIDSPDNSNAYYGRALYFFNENELDQALDDIKRALRINTSVAEFYFVEGNIYYNDQRFKEAFEAYQKVIELDVEHELAILKLSQIELVLKNYDLAIEMVNRALKLNTMNSEAYYLKGFIYLDSKDTSTAISSFQTAIEVDPSHFDSYIILGNIWSETNFEYAESYYKQALKIAPESIEALYNIGILYQYFNKYDEAYPVYDEILTIDSAAYFAYYNKGFIMLVSDSSYSGAINMFEKSLVYYPYYHQAYYNIGLCYENMEEYKLAEENYKKALEINPQFDLAARGLSRLLE